MGSFDEESTQFYSAEITLALEYLHSKDVIHRYIHCTCREILYVHGKKQGGATDKSVIPGQLFC